ncbi:holin [Nocardia fluminea]|uniref:holin n=1 Tax=Nocardia fluminea TaxID=134984 RepID=UPI00365EFFEF
MRSKEFWQAAGERALKTFIQTLLPALAAVMLAAPDWKFIGGAVLVAVQAALLSVLSSVASTLHGDPESPSLVKAPPIGRHGLPTGLG